MKTSIPPKNTSIIDVATGEVKAAKAPAYLQSLSLGSCVAVILYDNERKIGGIAHTMLPSSIHGDTKAEDLLKHVNHAIHELVKQMRELGASEEALTARIVGGALVVPDASEIGKENIEAVRNTLKEFNIRIADEHLGGTAGRSALFNVATGELQIDGKVVYIEATKPFLAGKKKEPEKRFSEHTRGLEEKIVEQTKILSERVKEFDNTRKATANLLEDLEKERKKLAEEKAKDEATLLSIGDGLAVVDVKGEVLVVNKSFEELLGWTKEEAVGKLMTEVVPREDEKGERVPFNERILSQVLAGKKVTTTTTTTIILPVFYYVRKNKTRFPVSSIITPVLVDNKIIGAVEVFRDITKEKEIDRIKSEFISIASHQLRTPLTGIKWFSELLINQKAGKLSAKQIDFIQQIYNSNERMIRLVNDLLDVSHIETGQKFAIEKKPGDIIVLINKAIKDQEINWSAKKITIKLDQACPAKLIFSFDQDKIYQVFSNLISNSIKYSGWGKEIIFGLKQSGDQTQFFVKDFGLGIPEHQKNRVFQRFFRADNIATASTDGTGLGLYIVKDIVEAHGGKIWFESVENKGTTFYFTLLIK